MSAPGYQSWAWTRQDWRTVVVRKDGTIDYTLKCGEQGSRTKSGKARLCLPKSIIQTLNRTQSGKEVLREQARKKARAKKGARISWHPRIAKLFEKLEKRTPKDNPKLRKKRKH